MRTLFTIGAGMLLMSGAAMAQGTATTPANPANGSGYSTNGGMTSSNGAAVAPNGGLKSGVGTTLVKPGTPNADRAPIGNNGGGSSNGNSGNK